MRGRETVLSLLELGSAKLNLSEPASLKFTVLPLKRTKLVLISVWDTRADRAEQWKSEMSSMGWRMSGYQVKESIPIAYRKGWEDGESSTGIVMVTLMKKNTGFSHGQFVKEWLGHPHPKAPRIHCLWDCIRNVDVVDSAVVGGSPGFDSIVEEHVPRSRNVANPMHFFGDL